jgi:hypothetical protein
MGKATSFIHHCMTTPCCSGSKLLTLGAVLAGGLVVEFVVVGAVVVFADTLVAGVLGALGLPVPDALMPLLPAPLITEV